MVLRSLYLGVGHLLYVMIEKTPELQQILLPVIELQNVSFHAQDKQIIKNLDLVFQPNKTYALIGPSGGGKSTALKLAAGLLVPTDGKILYKNQDIFMFSRQESLAFRKEAAFVFQDSALWANQNLSQILDLPLKLHFPHLGQTARNERAQAVVNEVGYLKSLEVRPAQLSMGEQKLIAFSRALLCDPSVLFLDEWTESLDDTAARRLIYIVKKRKEAGSTVLFISHNLRVIRELADHIYVIINGKLARSVPRYEFDENQDLSNYIEEAPKN